MYLGSKSTDHCITLLFLDGLCSIRRVVDSRFVEVFKRDPPLSAFIEQLEALEELLLLGAVKHSVDVPEVLSERDLYRGVSISAKLT